MPQQMVRGTGVGDAGANAYAHAMGMKPRRFVARFGAPISPRESARRLFPCWTTRARLMGSVIDGEDVMQGALVRAFVALEDLEKAPPLRPGCSGLLITARSTARSREVRMAEPIKAAADVVELDAARPPGDVDA